jgi:AAA domain-containing protein
VNAYSREAIHHAPEYIGRQKLPDINEELGWIGDFFDNDDDEYHDKEDLEEELGDWEETAEGDDLQEPTSTVRSSRSGFSYLRASDVEPVTVEWLWSERIPLGSLTLLTGDPGLGKSLLSCWLAAGLSRGVLTASPEVALVLSAEDRHDAVVVPRLGAAEADLDRICILITGTNELLDPVRLPDSVERLKDTVENTQAKLVIIDPLNAYLAAGVNSWKDQSVRTALAPLQQMAEATNAAVVLVTHLNKSLHGDALRRVGGSIGFAAAARSVLLLARDPDDEGGERGNRRVLAHVKSNFGQLATSLRFEVETTTDENPIAKLTECGESRFSANELVETFEANGDRRTVEEAIAFLEESLAAGPRLSAELFSEASQLGITARTLKRARQQLGVIAERNGAGWQMRLPDQLEPEIQE